MSDDRDAIKRLAHRIGELEDTVRLLNKGLRALLDGNRIDTEQIVNEIDYARLP